MIKKTYFFGCMICLMLKAQGQTVSDTDKNLVSTTTYDISGTVKSAGVSYYDVLGKPGQTQTFDIKTGKIWATQIIYDTHGRPALQTLSAPIGTSDIFLYRDNFMLKPDGTLYSLSDFETDPENPSTVGAQPNTLGWYYSEQNNEEPYQDITDYPFSRTLFDELNPGNVRKVIGGNKAMVNGQEQWISGFSYTLPATQELYYAFGADYFPSESEEYEQLYSNDPSLSALFSTPTYTLVTLKAYKTVNIDPHGVENVIFTDTEGKTLAVARSGEGPQKEVLSLIGTQGFTDIHIAKGCESGISYLGGMAGYKVYNLRTSAEIPPATTLEAGVYRIEAIGPGSSPPVTYIDKTDGTIHPAFGEAKGIRYHINYYDYSLNEYDKSGRLKSILQPIGFDNTYMLNQPGPAHNPALKSTFSYNALGQLIATTSPDEGAAQFKYRADGQIRYSQNSKQAAAGEFSYTDYDNLGRPVESGVLENPGFTAADPDTPLPPGSRKEQHFTVYDTGETVAIPGHSFTQSFTAGNVAKTYTQNPAATTTWYSYDIYGRVEWMIQDIDGLGKKTLHYEYDPVSGNIIEVRYQYYNASERFIHRYTYNEANELIKVETTTDEITYTTRAEYTYYETGALKRIDLANGLQGVDYVYNLAGQLKSINHPSLNAALDPGGDANDLFGMAIDYHNSDYRRNLGNIKATTYGTDQFNGNIKGLRWNNGYQPLVNAQNTYSYRYNRNNWLSDAVFGQYSPPSGGVEDDVISTEVTTSGNSLALQAGSSITLGPGFHAQSGSDISTQIVDTDGFVENADGDYTVSGLTYDANGNIQTLNRNKNTENGSNAMDALSYSYYPDGNRLQWVDDSVTQTTNADDIKDQDGNNYLYNEIGQLIENTAEGVTYTYNASGLVTEIQKNTVPLVRLYYNDRGQRVKKESYNITDGSLIQTTWYVRDASGSVMGIYSNNTLTEQPVYGLSRLGIYFRQNDATVYQLTDHLGNVRALAGIGGINGATDYYPGGMPMPNRQFVGPEGYRYGYQGDFAETDPETGKPAFELRLYDLRINRWLTTDPYKVHPSPYLGMANNPVITIDPDGGCPEGWDCYNDYNEGSEGIILDGVEVTLEMSNINRLYESLGSSIPAATTIAGTSFSLAKGDFLKGIDYNFYKNAPKGTFGVKINGEGKYWSNNFRGGTKAAISNTSVLEAKSNARSAINAGNSFKALSNSISGLSLGYTIYDATTNWNIATDNQKIEWGADAFFGVLAFTPAAPLSTIYFVGKFALQGSGPKLAFIGNSESMYNTIEIKIDNLRVQYKVHQLPLLSQ